VSAVGVIKRDRVRLAAEDVERPRSLARGATRHEKSARLVRLEGRVVGIEFTCACGESSLIELDFDQDAAVDDGGKLT
jgi:hypothetical protein